MKLTNDWKQWEKQCVICHKEIDKKKEKYVELKDWDKGKFVSHCFYHLDCWKNRFSITQEVIQKQANEWLDKISNLSNGALGDKIYELKN